MLTFIAQMDPKGWIWKVFGYQHEALQKVSLFILLFILPATFRAVLLSSELSKIFLLVNLLPVTNDRVTFFTVITLTCCLLYQLLIDDN
jgi:hypothetical protein